MSEPETTWQAIDGATRTERIERAMMALTEGLSSTKGMNPKERANRLRAELERRIAVAKDALRYQTRVEDAT